MGLDINEDFNTAKNRINSFKSFLDLNSSYNKITEPKGDSEEKDKKTIKEQSDKANSDVKKFKKKIKSQLERLLEINNVLAGKGNNSVRFVKNTFMKVLKTIEPIIKELLLEEAINAVGCDLDQTYDSRDIYIKLSALDLSGLLKLDPAEDPGTLLYEKKPIDVQGPKFSMNRELYERMQSLNSYNGDYGVFYKGASGQDLFDIQFVEVNNIGVTGPWYKISLKNRADGINNVKQFLVDYYTSISIIDFSSIIANIMNLLSGCISISANLGVTQNTESTKFSLFIQRVLGLCFDNVSEIDVSGIAKIPGLDDVNESFYEFDDLELKQIEEIVNNISNGVTELEDCDNIKVKVDTKAINDSLKDLLFVPDEDEINTANKALDAFSNSVEGFGLELQADFKAKIDFSFIKLIIDGLIFSLLSPKVLLPIYIMVESLGQYFTDGINSIMVFAKNFGRFITNLISRIGAIFVQKLFEIISKEVKQLLQQIIKDLAKEKASLQIIIVLKLIQLAIVVAEFVRDWRKCKSVIDELLWLLKIATTGWGKTPGFAGKIPYPLLIFSKFLDGSSATREFIGTIEEMQKMGIPTGALPDGSPNLDLLSKFGQMKASQKEKAENGNLELAISPTDVSPTRVVNGLKAYGKYF